MDIDHFRENLSSFIELAQIQAVIIEKHGHPQAVLVSYERYDELMNAFEDLEDLQYLQDNPPDLSDTIPWEDVKRDLHNPRRGPSSGDL